MLNLVMGQLHTYRNLPLQQEFQYLLERKLNVPAVGMETGDSSSNERTN
jgi:hypothetical protein